MLKITAPKGNCRNSQGTRQSTGQYRIKGLLESWGTKIHALIHDYWIKKGGFFAPNFDAERMRGLKMRREKKLLKS